MLQKTSHTFAFPKEENCKQAGKWLNNLPLSNTHSSGRCNHDIPALSSSWLRPAIELISGFP